MYKNIYIMFFANLMLGIVMLRYMLFDDYVYTHDPAWVHTAVFVGLTAWIVVNIHALIKRIVLEVKYADR